MRALLLACTRILTSSARRAAARAQARRCVAVLRARRSLQACYNLGLPFFGLRLTARSARCCRCGSTQKRLCPRCLQKRSVCPLQN